MTYVNKFAAGLFIYTTGAYASYQDMNKKITLIHHKPYKQKLSALIVNNIYISHHYAKKFYIKHVHPVIYIGAWPVVQFSMGYISIFTGVLVGCFERFIN